jgi:hypothetical protein
MQVSSTREHRAIEAVWRIESAALIAGLARIVRAVGVAWPFQSGRIEASAESPRAAVLTHDAGVAATPTARAGARSCNTLFRSLEYLVRLLRWRSGGLCGVQKTSRRAQIHERVDPPPRGNRAALRTGLGRLRLT